jgi:branched-chain amino acid aminotransferase
MNLLLTNEGLKVGPSFLGTLLNSDPSVYEVIRLIDGVALFLEDHFERLKKSMQIQGLIFQMDFQDFKQYIAELGRQNHKNEGNVKFVYSIADGNIRWAFSFIPHSYPSADDYLLGIPTDLLFAERLNPNAKVIQSNIRDKSNQIISDRKLYEVLLVNRNGIITEGSRSNVFFVKSDMFYTAPAPMVLVGITRQKVLDCIKILGFRIIEQVVSKDEIDDFDAVFLTGTSPKVLPVQKVGEQMFEVGNKAVLRLMESYNQRIQDYIRNEGNR